MFGNKQTLLIEFTFKRGTVTIPKNSFQFQDLVCSVGDIMDVPTKKSQTVRVSITVTELIRFYQPRNNQTMNI